MVFTILYAVYFLLIFLAISAFLFLISPFFLLFGKVKEWENIVSKAACFWGKTVVFGTFSKIILEGKENIPRGNVLIIANHQSYFDIPVILGVLNKPAGFLAKTELKKIPLLSFWMKRLHCVFIDRKKLREAEKYIQEVIENLNNGYSMVIFPEGTRSRGKTMKNFKPGSFKVAFKTNVPILPVTINGTYKLYEEKKLIRKGRIHIKVHPPIQPSKINEKDKIEFVRKVEDIIRKGVEESA